MLWRTCKPPSLARSGLRSVRCSGDKGRDDMTGVNIPDADGGGVPETAFTRAIADFADRRNFSTMQPSVNVAFWQNHVPVLTELTLATNSEEAAGDVRLPHLRSARYRA